MPYGKEDFLGWDDDDTNLDLLLGEYTCIEVELSDDETVHSTTDQPSATCSKTYLSALSAQRLTLRPRD